MRRSDELEIEIDVLRTKLAQVAKTDPRRTGLIREITTKGLQQAQARAQGN